MRKRLSILVLALICLSVSAKHVEPTIAETVARNFWNLHREADVKPQTVPMVSVSVGEFDAFYVFAPTEGSGFVIVAADDHVAPVLAYSYYNRFELADNANVRYWLRNYQNQISQWYDFDMAATDEVVEQWSYYTAAQMDTPPQPLTAVAPLITTQWDQYPYYNDLCPYDAQYHERAITGCAATAMAQVMKYWSFPAHGWGSHSYVDDDYGTLSADFSATNYAWSNMPVQLTATSSVAQKNAVATLMYHCGVSIEMDYGVNGSSAYMSRWDLNYPSVESSLIRYFGYNDGLHNENRDGYSDAQWKALLKTELDANRPVLYRGQDSTGGHAFICDGYNAAETQFHFNWGWSGYCDGYYSLSNLAPTIGGSGGNTSGTYNDAQAILVGVQPSNGPAVDPGNCVITRFPYIMNFDGLRDCWSIYDANADNQTWYYSYNGGVNGSMCANVWYADSADDYLISPFIATADSFTVNWQVRVQNAMWPETYQLYAGSTLIFSETLTSTDFVNRQASFAVAPGDTTALISRYISDDQYALYIDNIVINQNSATTQYTITVQSTDTTMGTVSGGGVYNVGNAVIISATANSGYHFTQWNDGNTSATRTIIVTSDANYIANFAAEGSECTVTTFPWSEGFEDVSTLGCWGHYDADGDGNSWFLFGQDDSLFAHNSDYAIVSASWMSSALTPDNWLFTPAFALPANQQLHLKWYAKGQDPNWAAEYYSVYVATTGGTVADFTATTAVYAGISTASWVQHDVDLSAYAGQTVYVAFRHHNITDMFRVMIDDVEISASSPVPQQYTVTVQSNNNAWGTVSGGGTYNAGTSVTLTATANSGYHFVSWQDGNTDNPRTVTVTTNATYTATFEADMNCPPVTIFPYNESFDGSMDCWTVIDGNNDSSSWRLTSGISGGSSSITPHSGVGMAASFSWINGAINANEYLVSPQFALPAGQTITLTWWFRVNGSYPEDKLAVKVSSTGNAVANFNTTLFDITPSSVHGNWTQQTVDLSAYAGQNIYLAFHHHDSYDANYLLVDDIQITISAPTPTYTITTFSNNNTWGTVTGGGTYNAGTSVTLTATPASGYHFVSWQDGNTDNPRTVTVTANATYTAIFEANAPEQYTLTVLSNNESYGTVSGGGSYTQGSSVTISATANSGYHFARWNDGNTQNPRTVTVNANATYVATFEADSPNPPTQYTLTVLSNNESYGTVSGGGTYNEGTTVTISATANNGYHFVYWNDGNTQNPRTVTVNANATYVATFEANVGIDDASLTQVNLYPNPVTDKVTLSGLAPQAQITLVDATGRILGTWISTVEHMTMDISHLSTGNYFFLIIDDAGTFVRKMTVK